MNKINHLNDIIDNNKSKTINFKLSWINYFFNCCYLLIGFNYYLFNSNELEKLDMTYFLTMIVCSIMTMIIVKILSNLNKIENKKVSKENREEYIVPITCLGMFITALPVINIMALIVFIVITIKFYLKINDIDVKFDV